MTDTTNKPLYVRCNGCQQAVPNRRLDVDAHKLNCPYDIKLALQAALARIEELEQTVERVDGHVEELATVELVPDIDSVGEWPGEDATDEDEDLDDLDEEPIPAIGSTLYTPAALT